MTASFQYVDGVCGSDKTYAAMRKMASLVKSGNSAIYVTNTKKPLRQPGTELEALKVARVLITAADPNYKSIIQKITSAFSESRTAPCVFLCATESLIRSASQLNQQTKLALYIGEGFKVSGGGEINCNTEQEVQGIAFKRKTLGLNGCV